jgi:ankyrin repeat protein
MMHDGPLPLNSVHTQVETLTELHMACFYGDAAVEHCLAMYRVRAGGDQELFKAMVNAKTTDEKYTGGYSPSLYACQNGFTGAAGLLLQAGADPNATKNNGAIRQSFVAFPRQVDKARWNHTNRVLCFSWITRALF